MRQMDKPAPDTADEWARSTAADPGAWLQGVAPAGGRANAAGVQVGKAANHESDENSGGLFENPIPRRSRFNRYSAPLTCLRERWQPRHRRTEEVSTFQKIHKITVHGNCVHFTSGLCELVHFPCSATIFISRQLSIPVWVRAHCGRAPKPRHALTFLPAQER
jgi:hypothetical protein